MGKLSQGANYWARAGAGAGAGTGGCSRVDTAAGTWDEAGARAGVSAYTYLSTRLWQTFQLLNRPAWGFSTGFPGLNVSKVTSIWGSLGLPLDPRF